MNYLSNFPLPIVSSWDERAEAAEACQKLLPSPWCAHVISCGARIAQAPLLSPLCASSLFPPITRLCFFPWQIAAARETRKYEYINMWWNADEGCSSGNMQAQSYIHICIKPNVAVFLCCLIFNSKMVINLWSIFSLTNSAGILQLMFLNYSCPPNFLLALINTCF